MRGKQGRKRDLFQGCSPRKTRCTKLYKSPRDAAVAFAKLMKQSENDSIVHLDFSSPSVGPSAVLREPTCSPMEGARLPLMLPGLKTLVCGHSQSVQHVSRPLTAAQLSLARMCHVDVPFVEVVPCMQGIECTAHLRPAPCAIGERAVVHGYPVLSCWYPV